MSFGSFLHLDILLIDCPTCLVKINIGVSIRPIIHSMVKRKITWDVIQLKKPINNKIHNFSTTFQPFSTILTIFIPLCFKIQPYSPKWQSLRIPSRLYSPQSSPQSIVSNNHTFSPKSSQWFLRISGPLFHISNPPTHLNDRQPYTPSHFPAATNCCSASAITPQHPSIVHYSNPHCKV